LTVTSSPAPAEAREQHGPASWRPSPALRSVLIWGVVVIAVSTGIVLWARTRPGFDPYGWLVWGHQALHGALNTNAAPSWKPLPFLFTLPYAIFGRYELWLWMITCVAVSLGGSIAAGRIAYRITIWPVTEPAKARRYAALAAGVFAGLALLGIQDWWHYMLSSQSDTMIAALCLGAIDCHLSGRHRWAFALGALAALGRPEVWPFLAIYSIWAWRAIPSMRWFVGVGVAAILFMWFAIPAITSRSPFVAASNAFGSGRRLKSDRVFGTIDRFLDLYATPLEIAALLSLVVAALKRDLVTLVLAAGAVAWVVIEIAFSLHGWPGLGRYMFPAAAVMVVVAAVLVGRILADGPAWLAERLPALRASGAGLAAAIVLVAVIVGTLVPSAVSRARTEHRDLKAQRIRTKSINRLSGTVDRLGGPARLNLCGEPLTRLEYQTVLAWTLKINVVKIGFKYSQAIHHGNPIVLFTPLSTGAWKVQALHQVRPSCRALPR
jgi:hypothetical protein